MTTTTAEQKMYLEMPCGCQLMANVAGDPAMHWCVLHSEAEHLHEAAARVFRTATQGPESKSLVDRDELLALGQALTDAGGVR